MFPVAATKARTVFSTTMASKYPTNKRVDRKDVCFNVSSNEYMTPERSLFIPSLVLPITFLSVAVYIS